MFESPKRHHLSRASLALTPGRDKLEVASAWELRGYPHAIMQASTLLSCGRFGIWSASRARTVIFRG